MQIGVRYPVTVVGSWPRPPWLLEAMKRRSASLADLQDQATLLAIKYQEDAGVDIVSDGEQRRDNFYSFISDRLEGIRLMTLAELLDYVEDKAAFENLLNALDVPAFAIKNPVVVGKVRRRKPLVMEDYRFLRQHTQKAVKVTLPGPYLLSRSTWVKGLSESTYPDGDSLGNDIVAVLREELQELASAGAEMVQFDEPVLSELLLAGRSATRTFMCAALAASSSPEGELERAVSLLNRVVEGIRGPILSVHVCRGNWSRNEDVLLSGPYDGLIPYLNRMKLDQFVLEYATSRAGTPKALAALRPDAQIGYGVVNPRTSDVEDPNEIVRRVRELTEFVSPDRIFLNPDCGFGTFAERPVADAQTAFGKLGVLAAAARKLRGA
ncbi:MAG TPA: cobalamin-independent methionine synthase II family protein [Candidatus Acidoferrales bacterium]|nr:cobalamin-independent methionine synthase II family protein [Candidatus Acidoferrales bacterium]